MKLNWGHKLVFFTVLFMGFIIFMVYRISLQKVDLVDDNYYEKGIRYQEEINKFAAAAEVKPSIVFDAALNEIQFAAQSTQPIAGTLLLYRASDETMDQRIPFALDQKGYFSYTTKSLHKGLWKASFEWTLNGKLMAAEKQFVMP